MAQRSIFPVLLSLLCLIFGSKGGILRAAPISPDSARVIGTEFLRGGSGRLKVPGTLSAQNLICAFTAKSADLPLYYVFNYDTGFVIVSADDRLPAVLGYSDRGAFNEQDIPENFRWWLGEYEREIMAYLPTAPEHVRPSSHRAPRDPIAPLTKTQWNQGTPFNNECPTVNGRKAVTGCVATAMSQIMKFHEWPKNPTGSNGGINFNGTTYEWDNMVDVYQTGKYSSKQAAAVAKLMRQAGAAVNMQYSPNASGAYDSDVQVALPKYFGYAPGLTFYWKDYTPMKEWINIVYAELAAGRPVYYSGSSDQGGHAFVCDGYSANDYFHFNWGWGGYEDGYFLLSALNPASGGAGSYEGGYNRSQAILTGIMPANTPGAPVQKQTALISTGDFVYTSEGEFSVANGTGGYDLVYNPLAYSISFDLGFEIVPVATSSEPEYVYVDNGSLQSFYGFTSFTADLPELPDGSYKLYPVFRSGSSSPWQRVLIPLGRQNCVTLIVKDGANTFTNDGPDNSYTPELIINPPTLPKVIYGDTDIAFHLPVLNVGDGDFNAQLAVTLSDAEDEFGDISSFSDLVAISAKSFTDLEVIINGNLSPGEYNLSVVDSNGKTYIDNYKIEVSRGGFEQPTTDTFSAFDLSPSFYVSGSESPIYFTVNNSSALGKQLTLYVEVLDPNTLKPIKKLPRSVNGTALGAYDTRFSMTPFDFKLEPGYYLYRIVDKSDAPLSKPYPLIVESKVIDSSNGLSYIITDQASKSAVLVAPDAKPYSGSVAVPSSIDGFKVTALRPDAFAFFEGASVQIDPAISGIPNGGFYCAKSMSALILPSTKKIKAASQTFNAANSANCWLEIPDNLIADYRNDAIWRPFMMPSWIMRLEDSEIASGVENVYHLNNVYYPGPEYPFSLSLKNSEGKNIYVYIIIDNQIVNKGVIASGGEGFPVPALGKKHKGVIMAKLTDDPVAVEEFGNDLDASPYGDIYSIDGRLIIRHATENDYLSLPSGLYIHGDKKIAVP